MDLFAWYLVISLTGSDELLVKETTSKKECLQQQKEFKQKFKGKESYFTSIDCQEGAVLQSVTTKNEDTTL